MAMGPIDYTSMMPKVDLGQSLLSGVQAGNAIAQAQRTQEQFQMQKDEYNRQLERQQQFQNDMKAYSELPAAEKPKALLKLQELHPEMHAQFKPIFDNMKTEERKQAVSEILPVFNALAAGKNNLAKQIVDDLIKAYENSGKDTKELTFISNKIKENPSDAQILANSMLYSAIGPEEYTNLVNAQIREKAATAKEQPKFEQVTGAAGWAFNPQTGKYEKTANIPIEDASKKIQPTSAIQNWNQYQQLLQTNPEQAKVFGQGAGFVDKNGKMSSIAEKSLSQANDEFFTSQRNMQSYSALADDIEKKPFKGGVFGGKWGEAIKDFTGNQDAISDLKKRYAQVKNLGAANLLPRGPASDKDVAFALASFPTENAPSDQIVRFLRGMVKIEENMNKFSEFKADYISKNQSEKGLVQAWKNFNSSTTNSTATPNQIEAARRLGIPIEQFMQKVR